MLRIVAENLAENAIRYAGHGATFTLSIRRAGEFAVLTARDDGIGVDERRPRAPLRALLARRRRAHLARHRPRARDREAHVVGGRRRDRGGRRPRPRPPHPLHLSAVSAQRREAPSGASRRNTRAEGLRVDRLQRLLRRDEHRLRERHEQELRRVLGLWPWVSAQKIIFRSSAACDVCCGTMT